MRPSLRHEALAGDILHSMVLADTLNDKPTVYRKKRVNKREEANRVHYIKQDPLTPSTSQTSSIVDASSLLWEAEMLLQQSPVPHYTRNNTILSRAINNNNNNNNNINSHDGYIGTVNMGREFSAQTTSPSLFTGEQQRSQSMVDTQQAPTVKDVVNINKNKLEPSDVFNSQWLPSRDEYHYETPQKQWNTSKHTNDNPKGMKTYINTQSEPLMTSAGEPTTRTSVVYTQFPKSQQNTSQTMDFFSSSSSSKDQHIDAATIRDVILSIKEARLLRRKQLLSYNKGTSSSSSSTTTTPFSFMQRLDIPRSTHLDTVEALHEAKQLLQRERKWLNMRCTILYDRLQQLSHHRGMVVHRLNEVYGENPVNIDSAA
ncbi:uncharacterized protein TM35_000391590 [Trypanosoma theileri]|uniref:Uncharacterized protein n=1 Tax=Trypanosoma theileri TaxID=67003 RepID=A0A1X0NJQ4_9TRYP|nr:uncharacterized protein TM35_000391590 [Trypanosoma theileri]ORC84985.1 hypothetical protein TM35_000391590 [Trypanosoma theileri]